MTEPEAINEEDIVIEASRRAIVFAEPEGSLPLTRYPLPLPQLSPLPGRVVVRMNDRLDKFPGSDLALDSRYIYQPYVGKILEVGEAINEAQIPLRDELLRRSVCHERCIFTPGNGIEFGTPEMYNLKLRDEAHPDGWQPFLWYANLRVFRFEDFACTLVGGDALGGAE